MKSLRVALTFKVSDDFNDELAYALVEYLANEAVDAYGTEDVSSRYDGWEGPSVVDAEVGWSVDFNEDKEAVR